MQPNLLQVVDCCRTCKLRTNAFFCDLSPATVAAFDAIKVTLPYYNGSLLFAEGDQARGIFVVCQGRVKLTIGSDDRTLVVGIANPGDVLGLPACMAGSPHQFTAQVMEPTQLNFVRREDFTKFVEKYPDACIRVAQRVSEKLHAVMDLIHTVGLAHSATERMARFFLLLTSGMESMDSEMRLQLAFTQRELAQTIGATRETACRVLGAFKKMNVVTLEGSTLVIQDKAALRELARII